MQRLDTRIRQLLLDDPTLSVAELQAYFSKQDLHPSRLNIGTTRAEFLATLRFLEAKGVLGGRSPTFPVADPAPE